LPPGDWTLALLQIRSYFTRSSGTHRFTDALRQPHLQLASR